MHSMKDLYVRFAFIVKIIIMMIRWMELKYSAKESFNLNRVIKIRVNCHNAFVLWSSLFEKQHVRKCI